MVPPIAIDIDGTMTRPEGGVDPRLFEPLRTWEAPVVVATGKSFPYPVALCEFVGIEPRVIAENGGVVATPETLAVVGDGEAARRAVEAYRAAGHSIGRGQVDLHNRWRETEVSVSPESPYEPLVACAEDHGQTVVDTGYSYHVKSPDVSKGDGLVRLAATLALEPASFVAIGDSANDVELFAEAGDSFAVANCDEHARAAADTVTEASHGAGALEALDRIAARAGD